jgi:hypothetical protein
MSQQFVSPEQAAGEEVAQQHLQEAQAYQTTQEQYDKRPFDNGQHGVQAV